MAFTENPSYFLPFQCFAQSVTALSRTIVDFRSFSDSDKRGTQGAWFSLGSLEESTTPQSQQEQGVHWHSIGLNLDIFGA